MKLFSIIVDDRMQADLDVGFNFDGFDGTKRAVLRAAVLGVTRQCREWRVDFLDLLTADEREVLFHGLEARR